MSLIVPISQNMRDIARSGWDKNKLRSLPAIENNEVNEYNISGDADRFYFGYLGEVCLYNLLLHNDKLAAINLMFDARTGNADVRVVAKTITGQPVIVGIDVKTARKAHFNKIMFTASQIERHGKADLYVGVRLNSEYEAEIFGSATLEDMNYEAEGFTDQHVPTYWQYLQNLTPIERLLEQLV